MVEALGGELREGAVAPGAGDDGEAVRVAGNRADDEVGEDADGGDVRLRLGEGLEAGVGLADIAEGSRGGRR